jgi:hypothetical protein
MLAFIAAGVSPAAGSRAEAFKIRKAYVEHM